MTAEVDSLRAEMHKLISERDCAVASEASVQQALEQCEQQHRMMSQTAMDHLANLEVVRRDLMVANSENDGLRRQLSDEINCAANAKVAADAAVDVATLQGKKALEASVLDGTRGLEEAMSKSKEQMELLTQQGAWQRLCLRLWNYDAEQRITDLTAELADAQNLLKSHENKPAQLQLQHKQMGDRDVGSDGHIGSMSVAELGASFSQSNYDGEVQGYSDANAATPPQSAAAFFDSAGSGGTAETPHLGASNGSGASRRGVSLPQNIQSVVSKFASRLPHLESALKSQLKASQRSSTRKAQSAAEFASTRKAQSAAEFATSGSKILLASS